MTNNEKLPKRLANFLIYLKTMKRASINTVNGYKMDNRSMLRYIKATKLGIDLNATELKHMDVSEVNDEFIKAIDYDNLSDFITYLYDKGNGACDVARKVSAIKGFFDYLVKKAKLMPMKENPALELEKPTLEKRKPVYLSIEESNKLLMTIKYDLNWKRDYCIVAIFLSCGLRVSELCNISLPD